MHKFYDIVLTFIGQDFSYSQYILYSHTIITVLTRDPYRNIFTSIIILRLVYGAWSWIKPSITLPSHSINHNKRVTLTISQILVIISSTLLPLHLYWETTATLSPTPVIVVVDQSRSMIYDDLKPSRWVIAQDIVTHLTQDVTQLPRFDLITYAHAPFVHSGVDYIHNLSPIADQQGSTALGDARLIAYDQITSGLDYKPIILTITDGGTNTGYDLGQTADILKTRAQLWIIGLSTGTQIVGYDDNGRGLTSMMDADLLSSLTNSGHRYSIPENSSIDGITNKLSQDLSKELYQLQPLIISLQYTLGIIFGAGLLGRGGIYLTQTRNHD